MTTITRRALLRSALAVGAALSLPLVPALPTPRAFAQDGETTSDTLRPAGPPGFEPWWVQTFLKTKTWADPNGTVESVETVEPERLFRVEGPQEGYRVPVWDARENRLVYIGVETIGPVGTPHWAD